jgi:hypothetical protein
MAQYAQYNPAVAAPSPVVGWFDADEFNYPNLPPLSNLLALTAAQWAARLVNPSGWAVSAGALVAYVPPTPTLTLAQQAAAALNAGLTITSTSTPTLNGTYNVDAVAQANINSMYNLIQRAGGSAFPGGLTEMPWADINGTVHTFASVGDFLAFETAVGDYVLALNLIAITNTGTMPAASATIP